MLLATESMLLANYDRIEAASSSTTPVWIDVCSDSSFPNTTYCVAVESASACSNNEQDTSSPTTGAMTAMPLLEATSEHTAVSDALHTAPSSASIVDETLEVDLSSSTTSITKAPASCSTDCSSQQPTADLVLFQASTSTQIKFSLDTNGIAVAEVPPSMTSLFPVILVPAVPWLQLYGDRGLFMLSSIQHITNEIPVHRPTPWPSFIDVCAYGDETRPLPWPSFWEINGCESPSDRIMKVCEQCNFDSSPAPIVAVSEFKITHFYGNLSIPTGCIIIHDMCNYIELRCLYDVLMVLQYWWSGSDCAQSASTVHAAPVRPSCSISEFPLHIIVSNLVRNQLSSGFAPITLPAPFDIGVLAALSHEYLDVYIDVCHKF